jgi:hypothetical protein
MWKDPGDDADETQLDCFSDSDRSSADSRTDIDSVSVDSLDSVPSIGTPKKSETSSDLGERRLSRATSSPKSPCVNSRGLDKPKLFGSEMSPTRIRSPSLAKDDVGGNDPVANNRKSMCELLLDSDDDAADHRHASHHLTELSNKLWSAGGDDNEELDEGVACNDADASPARMHAVHKLSSKLWSPREKESPADKEKVIDASLRPYASSTETFTSGVALGSIPTDESTALPMVVMESRTRAIKRRCEFNGICNSPPSKEKSTTIDIRKDKCSSSLSSLLQSTASGVYPHALLAYSEKHPFARRRCFDEVNHASRIQSKMARV